MSKKGVLVSIVLWSCVAFALLAALVFGIVKGFDFGSVGTAFEKGELHEVYSNSMDAYKFNSVSISWHAGNVQVRPSDDGQMHLTQRSYYKVRALDCDVVGDCLKIEESNDYGFFFFGFGSRSSDLELDLPSKQYSDFTLQMTSGNTEIDRITASAMSLKMTSGKLKADTVQAEKIQADITSGQMDVDHAKASSLWVEVTSGNADFNGSFSGIEGETTSGSVNVVADVVPDSLNANLTSGKVSVTIPDNDGFTLDYKKTSGDMKSDFDLMKSINDEGGRYTYKDGGTSRRNYSARLTSGTFELHKAG